MLLQVYYGQDDDINTLPILFACVVAYGAYKWIKSVIDQPSRQAILDHVNNKAAERDAKAKAIVEQNGLSTSTIKSPSLDSTAQSDEARQKAEAFAAASVKVAGMFGNKAKAKNAITDEESQASDLNDSEESKDIKLEGSPRWVPRVYIKREQQGEAFEAEDEISA